MLERLQFAEQIMRRGQFSQAIESLDNLLRDYPRFIAARLRRSEAYQLSDQYRSSRDDARACAALVEEDCRWGALPVVLSRLAVFGERSLASELALKADRSHEAVLREAALLSQHIWLAGKYEASIDFIRDMEARSGASPQLSYSLANALQYSGDDVASVAELERCLWMRPDYAYALWSLACHPSSACSDARVARIERAIASPSRNLNELAALHYAAYREKERCGRYEEAWQHLMQGAGLKREVLQIRMNGTEPEPTACPSGIKMEMPDPAAAKGPVFIVGLPRTGTTILDRELHKRYGIPSIGESGVVAQALAETFDTFKVSPLSREAALAVSWDDTQEAFRRALDRKIPPLSHDDRFIDKTPDNFWNVPVIARLLPSARFLCLVKDPVDACFSNLRAFFPGPGYEYSYSLDDTMRRYIAFNRMRKQMEELLPGRLLSIHYDEFVDDPDAMMQTISHFCALRPGDISSLSTQEEYISASASEARRGVSREMGGAWRHYEAQLARLRTVDQV